MGNNVNHDFLRGLEWLGKDVNHVFLWSLEWEGGCVSPRSSKGRRERENVRGGRVGGRVVQGLGRVLT